MWETGAACYPAGMDRPGWKNHILPPIGSGQPLKAEDPAFWEKIISLSNTGYRIQ